MMGCFIGAQEYLYSACDFKVEPSNTVHTATNPT